MRTFINSRLMRRVSPSCVKGLEFRCKHVKGVSLRQSIIPGWNQERISKTKVFAAGAGGLNGDTAEGLVLKGVGELHICDPDNVSRTNLNRQKFTLKDLYKNKAVCLGRNLSNRGFLGTRILAYPFSVQELDLNAIHPDILVCGVDNQIPGTRSDIAVKARLLGIPAIISAVSTDASYGYVFVQEASEGPCWGCHFKPEFAQASEAIMTCAPTPACCDILKALSGHVLYAIDTLLMGRKRDWNYRVISLDKSEMLVSRNVVKRGGCKLCRPAKENRS